MNDEARASIGQPTVRDLYFEILAVARDAIRSGRTVIIVPADWIVAVLDEGLRSGPQPLPPEPPGGYTIAQLVPVFDRTARRITQLIERGMLPTARKIAGFWRIPRRDVEAYFGQRDELANPVGARMPLLRTWKGRYQRSVGRKSARIKK